MTPEPQQTAESLLVTLQNRMDIEQVLNRYARACDGRDWALFQKVFTQDLQVNYGGEFELQGRDSVVDMIRSMLGGCGPTQHLLGNVDIRVADHTASSRCYVRAVHSGLGEQQDVYYEVWAEYIDLWQRTDDGWRISQREMVVYKEVGSRAVLGPETA